MVPITDKQALSRKTNKAPSHKRESILKLIDSWFTTKARTALIANMKQNGLTVRMEIGTFKMPPNEKTWYTETRWIVTWKEFTAESLTSGACVSVSICWAQASNVKLVLLERM